MKKLAIAAIVVLVIIVAGYFAWRSGRLNRFLPDKWKRKRTDKFRGSMGRTIPMEVCALGGTLANGFNACTWA